MGRTEIEFQISDKVFGYRRNPAAVDDNVFLLEGQWRGKWAWVSVFFLFYTNVNFFDDNFIIDVFDTLLSFLARRRRKFSAFYAFLHRFPSILEQI